MRRSRLAYRLNLCTLYLLFHPWNRHRVVAWGTAQVAWLCTRIIDRLDPGFLDTRRDPEDYRQVDRYRSAEVYR